MKTVDKHHHIDCACAVVYRENLASLAVVLTSVILRLLKPKHKKNHHAAQRRRQRVLVEVSDPSTTNGGSLYLQGFTKRLLTC